MAHKVFKDQPAHRERKEIRVQHQLLLVRKVRRAHKDLPEHRV